MRPGQTESGPLSCVPGRTGAAVRPLGGGGSLPAEMGTGDCGSETALAAGEEEWCVGFCSGQSSGMIPANTPMKTGHPTQRIEWSFTCNHRHRKRTAHTENGYKHWCFRMCNSFSDVTLPAHCCRTGDTQGRSVRRLFVLGTDGAIDSFVRRRRCERLARVSEAERSTQPRFSCRF